MNEHAEELGGVLTNGEDENESAYSEMKMTLMGSMHSLHKFLPKFAEVSAPLRPLLNQNNDFVWTPFAKIPFNN